MSDKEEINLEKNNSLDMNLRDNVETGEKESLFEEPAQQPEVDPELEGYSEEEIAEGRKYGFKTSKELESEGKKVLKVRNLKEFIDYGKQWDREKALEAKLDRLQKQLEDQNEYHKRNAEQLIKQSLAQIEQQLTTAKVNGDVRAVEYLAQQKIQAEQQKQQQDELQKRQYMAQIDSIFLERNKDWFNDSRPDLKVEAGMISERLRSENPNISYSELARQIENEIRWAHKDLSNPGFHQPTPKINTAPNVSQVKSSINKSTSNESEKEFRSLSSSEQAEFKATQNALAVHNIKYSIKDYLERK